MSTTTLFAIIMAVLVTAGALWALLLRLAPRGYQDGSGFHLGDKPERRTMRSEMERQLCGLAESLRLQLAVEVRERNGALARLADAEATVTHLRASCAAGERLLADALRRVENLQTLAECLARQLEIADAQTMIATL